MFGFPFKSIGEDVKFDISVADHCFLVYLTCTDLLSIDDSILLHDVELFHMTSNSTCYYRSLMNLFLYFGYPFPQLFFIFLSSLVCVFTIP